MFSSREDKCAWYTDLILLNECEIYLLFDPQIYIMWLLLK